MHSVPLDHETYGAVVQHAHAGAGWMDSRNRTFYLANLTSLEHLQQNTYIIPNNTKTSKVACANSTDSLFFIIAIRLFF
jgi:hypothetical protein